MTEEQKIKRAKELYGNLVYPKTHIELYVDGYLAGAKELEDQIADLKANCDLAIEGRDIKIKELETENAKLKSVAEFQQSSNMKRHFEIQELKKENAELKDLIKNIIRVTWGEGWNYSLDWKVKAEQFLKEHSIP